MNVSWQSAASILSGTLPLWKRRQQLSLMQYLATPCHILEDHTS